MLSGQNVKCHWHIIIVEDNLLIFSESRRSPRNHAAPAAARLWPHLWGGAPEERIPGNANMSEERMTTWSQASGLVTTDKIIFLLSSNQISSH